MIEIAYAIHDDLGDYYTYLAVSLISVMEHTKDKIRFHILCDATLREKNRQEFVELCERYGQTICFYDMVLDRRISIRDLLQSGYSEGIMYRLSLPELLPKLDRILYLDSDIIANGDVRDIWEFDLGECVAAGRWDPPLVGYRELPPEQEKRMLPFWEHTDWNHYINSGVMLMNLAEIRKHWNLWDEADQFFHQYGMALPDQDVMNHVFRGKKKLLPNRFNVQNVRLPRVEPGYFYHYTHVDEVTDKLDPIDELFLMCWRKTPYYRPEAGRRELVWYLRKLKSRLDVYQRLDQMGLLEPQKALEYVQSLLKTGRAQEACTFLKEDRWEACTPFLQGLCSYWMAKALAELGDRGQAQTICLSFLEKREYEAKGQSDGYIQKNYEELLVAMLAGELYYEEKEYEKAAAVLKKCIYFGDEEKQRIALRALGYLTGADLKLGRVEEAQEYNNMLLSIVPDHMGARLMSMKIERAKKKEQL